MILSMTFGNTDFRTGQKKSSPIFAKPNTTWNPSLAPIFHIQKPTVCSVKEVCFGNLECSCPFGSHGVLNKVQACDLEYGTFLGKVHDYMKKSDLPPQDVLNLYHEECKPQKYHIDEEKESLFLMINGIPNLAIVDFLLKQMKV